MKTELSDFFYTSALSLGIVDGHSVFPLSALTVTGRASIP